MKREDDTFIGGAGRSFKTTHWTEIVRARTEDDIRRHEAVAHLLCIYWKPVYCYLKRKGYDNERAKDLTQGFFQEVVLGRELILKANRTRGRFRTFLLKALNNYVASVHRAETAKKRRPDEGLVSLDAADSEVIPVPVQDATPEQAFHYTWASTLLDEVLSEVEERCRDAGKGLYWDVFNTRLLGPIMEGCEAPSLGEVCGKLGISDEVKASNMIVTVKRQLQSAIRCRMRQFVDSDEDVDGEIQDLMEMLSWEGAG